MTLEVEMPMKDNPQVKQKGRVYVCDLAGTEPAGDIFYALYKKVTFADGSPPEHQLVGPHKDQRKTKELQDQGKKINLSLSEMAQFFMKMAEAVKKKTLKPGKSIPGCNSYFLCKYLKDTMLQARTYLFCAIRPEVEYLNYTFSTLGFAKNASVIKLAPKKATVEASAAERKLMAELAELKALVAELQAGGGDNGDMKALLAAKQADLANKLAGGDEGSAKDNNEKEMKQQAEEYGRRGISLSHYEKDTKEPYFINLDEDPFRSNRFMYLLTKDVTVFGPGGDIKPLALSVVKSHCSVERHENSKTDITEAFTNCTLVGGEGETVHNGKKLDKEERVALKPFDRVAMGGELLLYRHPEFDPVDQEPIAASDAIEEYQTSIAEANNEEKVGITMRRDSAFFVIHRTVLMLLHDACATKVENFSNLSIPSAVTLTSLVVAADGRAYEGL